MENKSKKQTNIIETPAITAEDAVAELERELNAKNGATMARISRVNAVKHATIKKPKK